MPPSGRGLLPPRADFGGKEPRRTGGGGKGGGSGVEDGGLFLLALSFDAESRSSSAKTHPSSPPQPRK